MTRLLMLLLLVCAAIAPAAATEPVEPPALGPHLLDHDGGDRAAADALFADLAAHDGRAVRLVLRIRPRMDVPEQADKTRPVPELGYTARYLLRDGTPLPEAPPLHCSSGSCGGLDNFLRQVEVVTRHPAAGQTLTVIVGDRMLDAGQTAACAFVAPDRFRWTEMEIAGAFRIRATATGYTLAPVQ